MTTDSPWDPTRWREAQYPGHYGTMRPSQVSATHLTSQSTLPVLNPYSQSWDSRPQPQVPSSTGSYTDASTYHSGFYERRNSLPGVDGSYGPQRLTTSSPRQTSTGPWRSLYVDDRREKERHITDVPLTLHIPNKHDLPRISTVYTENAAESHSFSGSSQSSHAQPITSLPSFASFQEQASRADDPDEVEIAPMSSRISCNQCSRLRPMVREVANAIAELDENVQSFSNKSVTRTPDLPKDSTVRMVQWILDRIRSAKGDLQETMHRTQPSYHYQHESSVIPRVPSRNYSPPNPLKRSANRWEQDELPTPKRPRSGTSLEEVHQMTSAQAPRDDRRISIDFAPRDLSQRPGYSPPPTESAPGSAHPRQESPHLPGRSFRALPSPSSLAFLPSGAPSLAPATAQSLGSPATSYQPTSNIHTASTNSATSAHIADLQHQVTLKSLAHQTLQSEYASLLQKLQRERVKSQTIEKKTTVADQEVNDLTSKNEDLTEQIKIFETQLAESEQKRESERSESAKAKEQWGRMLEMGGRLHAKNCEDKQKLVEEKTHLAERIAAYEEENSFRYEQVKKDLMSRMESDRREPGGSERRTSEDLNSLSDLQSSAPSAGPVGEALNDVASLIRENSVLQARIEVLRFALEDTRRQNQELDERTQEFVQRTGQMGTTIANALNDEESNTEAKNFEGKRRHKARSGHSTAAQQEPKLSPKALLMVNPGLRQPFSKSPHPEELHSVPQSTTWSKSSSTTASTTRAMSPGPAELGFHVTPSNSSPEELIKALGPVPAPLPALQFGLASFGGRQDHNHGSQSQQREFDSGEPNPWMMLHAVSQRDPSDRPHNGPFRPLTHHVSSPYASLNRTAAHAQTSPRSYHSSPGPVMDDESSNSGSTNCRSPESAGGSAESSRPKDGPISNSSAKVGSQASPKETHQYDYGQHDQSQPQQSPEFQKDMGPTIAMPPPPRPGS